jgi:group I intron endonuclease
MSTNNKIWEENKNILPSQINYKHEEIVKCDITNETNLSVEKNLLKDITQKKSGIYKIVNKINGKYYVGSSKDVKHRWDDHIRELRKNNHYNDYLQKSWNKYGEQSFDFQFVKSVKEKELLLVEQKYLDISVKEQNKCYNLNFEASGGNISEYSREKIRMSKIGRKASVELRKKLSDVHKGIKLSESAKEKIRVINKGKKLSDEHKTKIGISNKGKKYSLEVKMRMSETRKGVYLGNKNPSYDSKVFCFYNKNLNITRNCTMYELYKEFNLHKNGISKLKLRKVKSYKGWTMILEN